MTHNTLPANLPDRNDTCEDLLRKLAASVLPFAGLYDRLIGRLEAAQ